MGPWDAGWSLGQVYAPTEPFPDYESPLAECLRAQVLGSTGQVQISAAPLRSSRAVAENPWCGIRTEPFEAAAITPVIETKSKTSPGSSRSFRMECSFQGASPPKEHSLLPCNRILVTVRQWVDTAPPSLGPSFNPLHSSRCLQCL